MLDCTFLLDTTTFRILEANAACERVLGMPAEKLVGISLMDWVDAPLREEFAKALRVTARRYYPRQFDASLRFQDGRVMHVEILACRLRLSDNTEILQVIAHDVSFKRESEAKVQVLLKDLQSANSKLEVLSTVDEMTGLFNFRHFRSELVKEHARSDRYSGVYSIVFCDIDYFKKYNDRNGHQEGDKLLAEFAKVLQKCCRGSDMAARYGGEEFAIICPGIDAQGASILAERIRVAVLETDFAHGTHQPLGRVTISIGVAAFPDQGKTCDQILKAADEALYLSKESGRNRVTISKIFPVDFKQSGGSNNSAA
jgi:diguanylate cyclase (GGDEF)-like protein/PAS domain S-box-containing protein